MSFWLIHTMCEIRYFPQCSAKYDTRIKATNMHACTWTKYKLQNKFGNQICDPTTHHAQQLDTRNKLNCLRLNLCLPPLRSEPQCQIVNLMVSHPNLLRRPQFDAKKCFNIKSYCTVASSSHWKTKDGHILAICARDSRDPSQPSNLEHMFEV